MGYAMNFILFNIFVGFGRTKLLQQKYQEMKLVHFWMVVLLAVVVYCQQPKLVMINYLFRHGARYPIYMGANDGASNYTLRQQSLGQLTTNGKKMHYLLGQQLYKQYWDKLFNDNKYVQSRFYAKSTDVNRTIESAQSQLMGILENVEKLQITENMREFSQPQWIFQDGSTINVTQGPVFSSAPAYHPMVIHTEKVGSNPYSGGDFLRFYSSENCPKQNQWGKKNKQNPRFQQMINHPNFTQALQNLSAVANRSIDFWEAPSYYDNYECSRYLGREFLSTFKNETYRRALYYNYVLEMYMYLYSDSKQISATATGFFNATVHNIKKSIANKDQVKWNMYSAHDTTVGNMLAALNLTNVECVYEAFIKNSNSNSDTCISLYPAYTSNLIFELWEYKNSSHTIKIRYNGQVRKIPFCDWQLECPVERFYAWYDSFKDENYVQTCGVVNTDIETYFSVAAAEFIIILVLALAGLVSCLKSRKKTSISINTNRTQPSGASSSDFAIKDSLLTEEKGN